MSKDFFRVKKGLNIQPTDPSGVSDLENGDIIIDSTDANKLKQYNADAGVLEEIKGSGGDINYLDGTNSDAEASVGDWVEYADAAGENPVDGTGGTANITFTRNTTSPLRGNADFKLSKDAVNRQGEGASVDFTIDSADQAQKLTISFDYDASNANYADNDLRVAIYDVTNASLIRVNGEDLKGGKGTHYAQFQTASDSTSYRLILHVSSTNAAAYDVFFDNVKVGPGGAIKASSDSMIRLYEGNGHGSTNTKIRRFATIAENIGGAITYTQSSTDGDSFTINEKGIYHISYTDGYNAGASLLGISKNSTQLTTSVNAISDPDRLALTVSPSANNEGNVGWSGILDKGDIIRAHTDGNPNNNTGTQPILFTISKIGEAFGSDASVSGGRDVVVEGAGNGGTSLTASVTDIDFTETRDTTASWNGTQFTAPETGTYSVTGRVQFTSTGQTTVYAYIDGTLAQSMGNGGASNGYNFAGNIYLEKGQQMSLRVNNNKTLNNISTLHHIYIQKLNSGKTALETETVAARYTSNSNQTINGTPSTYVYEDLDYDTHNAYNTSTGEYTVPISGKYMISAHTWMSINANTVGELRIRKNGSAIKHVRNVQAVSGGISVEITDFADFSKGDVIDITAYTNSGSSSSSNTEEKAVFSIAKIK